MSEPEQTGRYGLWSYAERRFVKVGMTLSEAFRTRGYPGTGVFEVCPRHPGRRTDDCEARAAEPT